MFTAKDARSIHAGLDSMLERLVRDAAIDRCAYVPIYWGPHMERRAELMAAELQIRGFTVTEIRDINSFRFAEVHFNWECT